LPHQHLWRPLRSGPPEPRHRLLRRPPRRHPRPAHLRLSRVGDAAKRSRTPADQLRLSRPPMNSFVLAVVLAAIVAVSRLGGEEETRRRFFQAALAFVLMLLVQSAAITFVRLPDPFTVPNRGNADRDVAEAFEVRTIVQMALGSVLVALGIQVLDRWET